MLSPNKQAARQAAIRILNFRAYSEKEVRHKLSLYGFDVTIIDEVINYLLNNNYINDKVLCDCLFDNFCRSNKYSLKFIIMKLKQRGIPEVIIHEVIKRYDFSSEAEAALKIAKKRFKQAEKTDKIRVSKYLAGRGFSASSITSVIYNLECNTLG
ncbi:Regulatory protein RecX [bioreactor metagenome]|uniref:Regulatory protein RecX n=1 Tax=bioreactor metagenome TaxID=1076179 RepID=A0A645EK39_9ZZZZ